ncbi:MAG: hypothetical protein H0T73_07545 [Ardenticatenales bacterium]|nr:hypothetical protein [Ardenticatenales bacterium]
MRPALLIRRLSRLFRIRAGEGALVFLLGFLLMGNSFALEVSDVLAISGFLDQVGLQGLLVVWVIDMLLIILTAGLQSLVVDRFRRTQIMQWMCLVLALVYLLLRFLFLIPSLAWLNYSLLYLLSDQQWLFFPLVFWVMANDIFDVAGAKRLFPLIAAGGLLGRVAGLLVAAAAPTVFGWLGYPSAALLSVNSLIYLGLFFLILWKVPRTAFRDSSYHRLPMRETLAEGQEFIRNVSSFKYLTFSLVAMGLALTIIEYHFLAVSHAAYEQADRFQTFYSLYRLGETLLAVAIQGFITSRLIDRISLKNSFLLLPATSLVSITWMLAIPGILSGTGGRLISRLVMSTIDESARKAFQGLVPEARRGRVSMFMDSYLFAIGTILGSLILAAIIFIASRNPELSSPRTYLIAAFLVTLGAVGLVIKMRQNYDMSLLNWRLTRRRRGTSTLDRLDF